MNEYEATERAYKNGYADGQKDARKKGVWLNWQGGPVWPNEFYRWWCCSECKHQMEFDEAVTKDEFPSNFCPNCGADMRGEEDG